MQYTFTSLVYFAASNAQDALITYLCALFFICTYNSKDSYWVLVRLFLSGILILGPLSPSKDFTYYMYQRPHALVGYETLC